MKKYVLFTLIFILTLFSNLDTASAAVGDRSTPYSAYKNHRFTWQEYDWDSQKVIELQLTNMYKGTEANRIVAEENMFDRVPASDEEWLLMGFNLKYVSGPEEPLYATDVIWTEDSFYTKSGTAISPIDSATLSYNYTGQYDVELYPGGSSKVWYGILVKKTVGYPLFKVASGYDQATYQTKYKWFSTDPSYGEPIPSPTNTKAVASSYNSVKLSWTAASGVSGYEIYRSTSSNGTFSKIGSTTSTSYTHSPLNTGTTYYYKVRSYKTGTKTTYSNFTPVVSAKPVLARPASVKATSASYNSIKTSWSAVSGANGYQVYRATTSSGTYSLIGTTTSTNYTNGSLSTDKPYYYKVRAYRTVGTTKVYSNFSPVVNTKPVPAVPTNFKASRIHSTSLKITWSGVSGANGYELYRATSSTGTYSLLKGTNSLYFTNSGLTTGKTYYYKLRAYRMVGTTKVYSGWTGVISGRP